ncbi:hypothetical protein [Reinekea blandensis]|uniref:Protoporphyrinogen IX oxidase n=1 Tax=Reinekea blandensis MED297 TaxID=314283 RepID=A4BCA0_9GAMM|nr:hypothetical protein [Reinekea blandensis]EAR10166.1 hypothetical protein MED297_13122 [Reinekea sp. MED297] [Reinekea blandensis MED297]
MLVVLLSLHLVALSAALGGRLIFIAVLHQTQTNGLNERLDELQPVLPIVRYADFGLIAALLTGTTLFLLSDYSLTSAPWAFKLKLVALLLLIVDIGAFHIAQARINQHYDKQMLPALSRLNNLAVVLMSTMVLFSVLA